MKRLVIYTFYRIAKRIIRFFVTLSLVVSICFGSVFYHYENVEAAAVGALDVVGAIGSILGIANVTSGGSVTGLFADQKDKIQQWWSNYTGNGGIYVDSNNNYVFSGEATNALYESLDANFNTDAKVVSSFPSSALNVPASFYTPLNTWRSENNIDWKNVLKVWSNFSYGNGNEYSCMYYYNLTDVAFITMSIVSGHVKFYFFDSNGSNINVRYQYSYVVYSNNDLFRSGSGRTNLLGKSGSFLQGSSNDSDISFGTLYLLDNNYFTNDGCFVYFPFSNFNSIRSLIVAKNVNGAFSAINKNSGVFVTNNYYGGTIPPISKTVFEENNWDSVYNSYINNINNNSENWFINDSIDVQALRDEMAKQSNIITDAIVEGNTDIAGKIDYTNEWLKKIYNLLGEIKTLVANNQGGGGSSSADLSGIENQLDLVNTNFSELISKLDGVSSDLEDVLQALYSIESFSQSIDTKLDDLEQSYLVLSNIYSYMQLHPWGSGGGGDGPFITPTDDPWAPWFHYIDDDDGANFPYGAILTKYNIIKTLIQGAAPYCFIAFIGGVLNSLEVEPVTPEFTIPVKSNGSIVQVDEELHFDLSGFEILLPYIHAMFIILFTVGLMWFSFPFIRNLIQIFDL